IRQARAPFTVLKSRFRIEAAQDFEKATDGFQEGSAAVAHDKSIRPRADKQMHDDTSKCLESLEKVIEPEGGPSHRGPPEPRLMKSQGGPWRRGPPYEVGVRVVRERTTGVLFGPRTRRKTSCFHFAPSSTGTRTLSESA